MHVRGAWRLRATSAAGAAAALALLAAGCADLGAAAHRSNAPRQPASRSATVTRTTTFVPAGTSRTVDGSCWTSSITVSSADAYRCAAGNRILDPCFVTSRSAHTADCYADPWTPGVRLTLDQPLPAPDPLPIDRPWALELGNGKHCVAATGAVDRIGATSMLYLCHGGGAVGAPDHAGTAAPYAAPGVHTTQLVPVSVIWQA